MTKAKIKTEIECICNISVWLWWIDNKTAFLIGKKLFFAPYRFIRMYEKKLSIIVPDKEIQNAAKKMYSIIWNKINNLRITTDNSLQQQQNFLI